MYNLSISSVAESGLVSFKNKLTELGSDKSNRFVALALIALSCLAAAYLAYRLCHSQGNGSKPPFYSPPIYSPPIDPDPDPVEDFDDPKDIFDFESPENLKLPVFPAKKALSFSDEKPLGDEQNLVAAIQEKWLDNPEQEAKRVLDAKLIPGTFSDSAFKNNRSNEIIRDSYAVMGRVLEIKKLYSPTHYVFTHGQASSVSIVNQVTKECVRVFHKSFYHPLQTSFRLPHTVKYSENVADFNKQYDTTQPTFMDDGHHSDKMISVDAQFSNQQGSESALHFFSRGTNISFTDDHKLRGLFISIFKNYVPNDAVCGMLAEKGLKIAQQRMTETKVGLLYAICIPKEIIKDDQKNFAYPCHPFGKKCSCFPDHQRIEKLEEMQADKLVRCNRNGNLTQYRILTARLAEERDVRIFDVDLLSRAKRKDYQKQVEALVEEVRLCSVMAGMYEEWGSENKDAVPIIFKETEGTELNPAYVTLLANTVEPEIPVFN